MKDFEFRANNFDLIRLLAALQVTFVHGIEHFKVEQLFWLKHVLSYFPGVPIFFVISGFLIASSFDRSKSLEGYISNRILRIFPALWGCLVISTFIVLVLFKAQPSATELTTWLVAQASILQVYNPEFIRPFGVGVINGSLWTIPIELQFYILLPLIFSFFQNKRWANYLQIICLVFFIIIYLIFIQVKQTETEFLAKVLGVTIVPYFYLFFIGVILYKNIFIVEKYLANRFIHVLTFFILTALLLEALGLETKGNYTNPISSIFLGLLTLSGAYSYTSRLQNILKGNDFSYGVYIYHMVFVNLLLVKSSLSELSNFILMLIFTLVFACLSWKCLEKPALGLKRYSIKKDK